MEKLLKLIKDLTWYNKVEKSKEILRLLTTIFLQDAPEDGNIYGRKDGAWEEVTTGGDGSAGTLQQVLDNNHDLVDGNNFQGTSAGDGNTGINVNAFGQDAANTNAGNRVNALGTEAAFQNTGESVNAFGSGAASQNTGGEVNAFGTNSAAFNTGINLNAFGASAGEENTGDNVNAFGNSSAYENTGTNVNAFGSAAASQNTGDSVNAFGEYAAAQNTAEHVNAFGLNAGLSNTFKNVNLFGYGAIADADNQTVFSKWVSGLTKYLGRLSFNNITADRKWELIDESGDIKLATFKTANFTAVNSVEYATNGTITVTDPTPVTNKGYIVHVISGTTTIGGVGYISGALVYRFYNGTSWISKNYGLSTVSNFANDAAASTGGIPIGGLYHTSGTVKIRLV